MLLLLLLAPPAPAPPVRVRVRVRVPLVVLVVVLLLALLSDPRHGPAPYEQERVSAGLTVAFIICARKQARATMMEAVLQALRAGLFVGFDAPALASLAATCRAARGVVGRDAVLVASVFSSSADNVAAVDAALAAAALPPLGDKDAAGGTLFSSCAGAATEARRGELARALAARIRREAPAERRRAVRRLVLLAVKDVASDAEHKACDEGKERLTARECYGNGQKTLTGPIYAFMSMGGDKAEKDRQQAYSDARQARKELAVEAFNLLDEASVALAIEAMPQIFTTARVDFVRLHACDFVCTSLATHPDAVHLLDVMVDVAGLFDVAHSDDDYDDYSDDDDESDILELDDKNGVLAVPKRRGETSGNVRAGAVAAATAIAKAHPSVARRVLALVRASEDWDNVDSSDSWVVQEIGCIAFARLAEHASDADIAAVADKIATVDDDCVHPMVTIAAIETIGEFGLRASAHAAKVATALTHKKTDARQAAITVLYDEAKLGQAAKRKHTDACLEAMRRNNSGEDEGCTIM